MKDKERDQQKNLKLREWGKSRQGEAPIDGGLRWREDDDFALAWPKERAPKGTRQSRKPRGRNQTWGCWHGKGVHPWLLEGVSWESDGGHGARAPGLREKRVMV